jgi:hypothetical protein
MRRPKIRLTAGASLLALAASPAAAQEWSVSVGGFMLLGAGYVDSDAHEAEVEIVNDSEVIFNFRLIADNGLTFGAKAELENNGSSNNMDEYVGWVEGSFGRVEIGAEDGAHDRLAGSNLAGGMTFTSAADSGGFLFDYAGGEAPVILSDVEAQGADTSDDLKITYFTPVIAGFQAGVSYANSSEGGTSTDGAVNDREAFEIGARYRRSVAEFSIDLYGGATFFSDPYQARFQGRVPEEGYTVGGNLGYAGFKAGVVYGVTGFEAADDDEVIGVGASYETGPWSFGVQYAEFLDGDFEDDMGVSAGVDYVLAPGVTLGAVVEYADGKEFDRAAGAEDAWAVGLMMGFDF